MATTNDNLRLDALDQNAAYTFWLGRKKYKIRQMTCAVSTRRDRLVAQRCDELKVSDNPKTLLLNLSKNRSLIPKCLSLMMLHSWFNVTFFHWIHWRILYAKYTMNEMIEIFQEFNKIDDVSDFFRFTASLQENNRIVKRMSETSTETIRQELKSGAATKSSSNSTDQ